MWNRDAASWIGTFESAVFDQAWVLPYVRVFRGQYVLSLHNVEHRLLASLPTPDTLLRRLELRWEINATRRLERVAAVDPRALVVTVSPQDRDALGAGIIVPNGADLPLAPGRRDVAGPPLFVGSLDYGPNLRAVEWWVREVWPHLPAGMPPLTVVGRGGARALGSLAESPAVNAVGEVPDVGPFLERAGSVVVPLQHGGGSRLKVLEALAWERPVVSTRKGVEGLALESGRHVLVADSPEAFAAALLRVMTDAEKGDQLTRAGRQVAEALSWGTVAARFADQAIGHLGSSPP
jgi:glycosyltransferase involved in cell wall biosynthesis